MIPDAHNPVAPNAVEERRRPDGPAAPGESLGKRTNDERNDPEREPGAAQGQRRERPGLATPEGGAA